jgi:hypothetical protein
MTMKGLAWSGYKWNRTCWIGTCILADNEGLVVVDVNQILINQLLKNNSTKTSWLSYLNQVIISSL